MATVACTRMTEVALGRMCRISTQRSLAPSTTAAATKSSDFRRRVSERTTRMTPGICAMPMASAALPRLAPRMAASPTARMRKGNASSRSVSREISGVAGAEVPRGQAERHPDHHRCGDGEQPHLQ